MNPIPAQAKSTVTQTVVLFLTAFAIRLVVGWQLGHFFNPTPLEMEIIANNLLAGQGFVIEHLGVPYRAFLLPAYPLFCAAVYALTHHHQVALLILQCLISAAACLQVRAIGNHVFPAHPNAADAGAWLVAFHPPLIFYSSLLHTLTLDHFAFLWVLWAWLRFRQEPTGVMALHVGLASGFALLSRGTIIPFLLLATGWFYWEFRDRPQKTLALLGLMGFTTGVLVTPWLIRNALRLHRFPIVITSASQSFWQGNNPLASGSAHLPDGRTVLSTASPAFYRQLSQLDEGGQSRLFQQEAWRFIQDHPLSTLRLYGKKLKTFWWFAPQAGLKYPPPYSRWYRWYYSVVGTLILAGFWRLRRQWRNTPLLLLLAYASSIAAYQSLYYVDGRHRWLVEPVLLLFAAISLGWIRGRLSGIWFMRQKRALR